MIVVNGGYKVGFNGSFNGGCNCNGDFNDCWMVERTKDWSEEQKSCKYEVGWVLSLISAQKKHKLRHKKIKFKI